MSSEEEVATSGSTPASSARAHLAAYGLLLLALAAHWLPRLSGPVDLHYDGATYYVLGASLAAGKGYRLLNEPGEIEALQYPPLFPLWIAGHMRLLGSDDPVVVAPVLRLSQAALALALAFAVFALARRWLSLGFALFSALVSTLCFRTVYLSDLLFPETLFTLTSVLFFLASGAAHARWRRCAGPLAMAAYLIRTLGITLLAVWVAEALLARRWKSALVRALLALAPLVLWQGFVARVESSADYREPRYEYQRAPYLYGNVSYGRNLFLVDPFAPERGFIDARELARRVGDNARHFPAFVGELVLAPLAEFVWPVRQAALALGVELDPSAFFLRCLGLVGLLTLFGLAWLLRAGVRGPPLHVLASLGIIALTPWQNQFWRYLTPLTPFFALGLAWCLARTFAAARARWPVARWPRLVVCACALGVLAAQVKTTRSMFVMSWRACEWRNPAGELARGQAFYLEEEWRVFEEALAWLRANAEPDALVACAAPQLAYLGTGLRAVLPPFEPEPARARALLDSVPVRYVIVDEFTFLDVTRRYTRPMLEAQPESWELVCRPRASSTLSVWRRKP